MAPLSDDALTPLVPGPRVRQRGITTNRVLSIISLAGLLGISLYFQWQVHQLGTELASEERQISDLNAIISTQAEVIQRFNNSVSNSDVLKQLHLFEKELNTTEDELKQELKKTENSIRDRLRETLTTLDETVKEAQNEISDEVKKVKDDVDQYVRTTQDQFSMENDFMIYQLAGTFTLLSGLISMWHMTAHLRRFNQPFVQRKILAILWMSPIYAITSWLSLVFIPAEGYLAIVKDFYEAYVIYMFLSFCIAVLGRGDRNVVVDVLAQHANHLTPPFRLCGCCNPDPYESDRELADAVLLQCQSFAMQFVFLKPVTTIALFVLEKMDYYGLGESSTDYRSPQFYLILVQNLSVFIAFAGLLKFYHAADKDLAWCRPFAKFLCIKGVVFMTFWQGLAISILATATDVAGDDAQAWARSSQNFLICLEMLLFSIAHFYCFPVEEWEEGYKAAHSSGSFGDSIALNDFLQDLKLIVRSKKKKKKKKKKKRIVEPQILEGDEDNDDEGSQLDGDEDDEEETQGGTSFRSEETDDDTTRMPSELDEDDVQEAAARLIDSLAFCGAHDDKKAVITIEEDDMDDERDELRLQEDDTLLQEEDTSSPKNHYASDSSNSIAISSVDEESPEPPNETTSLLGGTPRRTEEEAPATSMRTPNDEILRPSIFTTVSEIGEASLKTG